MPAARCPFDAVVWTRHPLPLRLSLVIEARQLAAAAAPKHAKPPRPERGPLQDDAPTVALPSISSQPPVITHPAPTVPGIWQAPVRPAPSRCLYARARRPTQLHVAVSCAISPDRDLPDPLRSPNPSITTRSEGAPALRIAAPTASAHSPGDGRTAASRPLWPWPRNRQTIASASRSTSSRMATGSTEVPASAPGLW